MYMCARNVCTGSRFFACNQGPLPLLAVDIFKVKNVNTGRRLSGNATLFENYG